MLGAKKLNKTALCLLLLTAQPVNAANLFDRVVSACDKLLNGAPDRAPQSVKPAQASAYHKVINHVMDGPATGALFLFDQSEDRIIEAVGETQEIPKPEIYLGEPQNIEKILDEDFVVIFTNEDGDEVSEFGTLISIYPPDGQSWVETITIYTDSGQSVEIPVADVVRLYELNRL